MGRLSGDLHLHIRLFLVAMTAALASLFLTLSVSGSHTDSMYPTQTWGLGTGQTCSDGGSSVPNGTNCQTDNSTVTYWVDDFAPQDISSTGDSRIWSVMFNDFDPTDLLVVEEFTPSFSGGSETDIIFQERASQVPASADGVTWCDDAVSSTKCDQHYVIFDNDTPGTDLICHEAGHAVGLQHGDRSYPIKSNGDDDLGCLTTDPIEFSTLGSHNEGQINGTY